MLRSTFAEIKMSTANGSASGPPARSEAAALLNCTKAYHRPSPTHALASTATAALPTFPWVTRSRRARPRLRITTQERRSHVSSPRGIRRTSRSSTRLTGISSTDCPPHTDTVAVRVRS